MDRKRLTVKYGSLVHLSCDDGYITAAGLEGEGLFLRGKTEVNIDQESVPLLGFETSVFRVEAPATSSAAKVQVLATNSTESTNNNNNSNTLLMDHFSKINTAPDIAYGQTFLLRHEVSQMHVAVFPSKPSENDPDSVQLALVRPGEVEPNFCEFVFTSQYKIHDDGDLVCRGDEVLLRLAAHPIFLHVTMSVAKARRISTLVTALGISIPGSSGVGVNPTNHGFICDNIMGGSLPEVNGSEEKSVVFVVQRYDIGRDQANYQRAVHHIQRPYISAGVPVALYHCEQERLLTTSLTLPRQETEEDRHNAGGCTENSDNNNDNKNILFYDDDINGNMIPTRKHYSFTEGLSMSRGALHVGRRGVRGNATTSAHDEPYVKGQINPDSAPGTSGVFDDDDNKSSSSKGDKGTMPYPLFLKDAAPASTVLNEESTLDDAYCSCEVLWIFENADPTIGGAVRMQSTKYRIRQACSNLYLSVSGSSVDAFFDDCGGQNELAESFEGIGLPGMKKGENHSSYDSQNRVRATSLCMIPPPRSHKDLQCTLFTVSPMFASACDFLIEKECLLLQNDLTGMYVCTDDGSQGRLSLSWQPSPRDTITARKVHPEIERSVMFLLTHCERLCRYRDAFQALITLKELRQESERRSSASRSLESKNFDLMEQVSNNLPGVVLQDDEISSPLETSRLRREKSGCGKSYLALLPIIHTCQRTLGELIRFCSLSRVQDVLRFDGVPILRCQRLMFDLSIHRLIMDVILAPFSQFLGGGPNNRATEISHWSCSSELPPLPLKGGVIPLDDIIEDCHQEVHLVCRLAFRLLRQMVRKASMLKKGFDQFIPYFLELDGRRFRVVDTLTELFSDNANISGPALESVVDHFVDCSRRVRSGGYLELLASMCTLGFSGLRERQTLVCQKLLVANDDVLFRFVLNDDGEWSVIMQEGESPIVCRTIFDLELQYAREEEEQREEETERERERARRESGNQHRRQQHDLRRQSGTDEKYARFLRNEIDLLGRLCFDGCPPLCRAEVARVFPADVLLRAVRTLAWTGAEAMSLPSSLDALRAPLLRLAVQCYIMPAIDDPAVRLRAETVLFAASALRLPGGGDGLPISCRRDDDLTAAVKTATINIICANPHFVQSDVNRSVLLRTSLNTWLRLVRAHQVSVSEMLKLIPPLLRLLDGAKDIIDDNASRMAAHSLARLDVSEASVRVIRAREMICKTLLQILNWMINRASDKIILLLHDSFVNGTKFPHHKESDEMVDVEEMSLLLLEKDSSVCPCKEEESLLKEEKKGKGFFQRFRRGYQSVDSRDDSNEMDNHCINSQDVVNYLGYLCRDIMHHFRVSELVPLLMDLTRYDSQQLTAQSAELLIRLCSVKRIIAHRVLQIHTLPSAEIVRNFDKLYTVAVEIIMLQRRGCIDEAVAFALISIEHTEVLGSNDSDDDAGEVQAEEKEEEELEEYIIDDEDDDDLVDNNSTEEGGSGGNTQRKQKRRLSGCQLWAKASGAANMLAYRSSVRQRRRLMGLREASKVPLYLVVRMELVCHWGIHIVLLRMHSSIDPASKTFFHWMRFFYLFTLSSGNSRKLLGHIDLFMRSLVLNEECTVMCLHIILAIFASIADPTPYLSNTFLKECVAYINKEISVRHPDDDFLSQLSNHVFSKSSVGGIPRRRMMQLLRDRNTLHCLPRPGTQFSSVRCGFISSLIELLCQICSSSTSALAMGQRTLPMHNIFAIILQYGTLYNPLHSTQQEVHESSRKGEGEKTQSRQRQKKNGNFRLVGTYLHAVVSLYITADKEEGGQGKEIRKMEWMANSEWWSILHMLASQLQELCEEIVKCKKKVVNHGIRTLQHYRYVWLIWLPLAFFTFFSECFSETGFYQYRDFIESMLIHICDNLVEFCLLIISYSDNIDLRVREVVYYRRLLYILHAQIHNIVGFKHISDRLHLAENKLLIWLLKREKINEKERQYNKWGKNTNKKSRHNNVEHNHADNYTSHCDILLVEEGSSQVTQDTFRSSYSAGLCLSSYVNKSTEVEVIRHTLRTFLRRDVLIPVHDSVCPGETAYVINKLLQCSSELSAVRGFVWNILEGMRKRYFSPMTLVGLLNLFYNALHSCIYHKEISSSSPQEEEEEEENENQDQTVAMGEGRKKKGDNNNNMPQEKGNSGYLLQITFSDLGMPNIVASLTALDNEILTYGAVRLSVMLLEGGNKKAQDTLLQYFETHQEGIFYHIRDVMQSLLRWIRRLNIEQQLVILERGGMAMSSVIMRDFTPTLFAYTVSSYYYKDNGNAATDGSIYSGNASMHGGGGEKRVLGWDRAQGCMRLRLLQALFRMLQLFCEGHNFSMQNYIRLQHDNTHSVNIVYEVIVLLSELSKIVHVSTVQVIYGGFELLTELCQGPCHGNQQALLSYDVCTIICNLLRFLSKLRQVKLHNEEQIHIQEENEEYQSENAILQRNLALKKKDIDCLRTSLTTCLLSLIEGCRSHEIFSRIFAQIPMEIIEEQLFISVSELHCHFLDEGAVVEDDNPEEEVLVNWLTFLNTIRPHADGLYLQHIDELLRRTKKFANHLGFIEVRRKDGLLEKVFFRIPRICRGLSQFIKDDLLWSVNRTSRATKLGDFLHQSDNLIFEVERAHWFHCVVVRWTRFKLIASGETLEENENNNYMMRSGGSMGGEQGNKIRCYSFKKGWNQYIAPFLFSSEISYYEYASILLAGCINIGLISVDALMLDWNLGGYLRSSLTWLCTLQFIVSCVILCIDTVVFFPVCLYRGYRRKEHLNSGVVKLDVTMDEVLNGLTIREIIYLFCTQFTIQFRILLAVMAFLSIFFSHYYAATHLLLVIYKVPTLRTFITAITQNGKQLLLSALLGTLVLYLFAIIGYLLFPQQFTGNDGEKNENCVSLFRCFLFILWQGLRQGGGVGDIMEEEPWSSGTLIPRVTFDLMFFAFVNVVFLNIMFGIIIDTFGELRDAKREKEVDMMSTCFICGLGADVFERAHIGGFRAHVKQEHNMWMYFYFLHHLRRKDPNNFTGQESYVDEMIRRSDLSFFPEEDCISLQLERKDNVSGDEEQEDAYGHGYTSNRGQKAALKSGGNNNNDTTATTNEEVAATLKEFAAVKEALSVFVRDVGEDAQKVRSMIQQLEISNRSAHTASFAGNMSRHAAGFTTGTYVSKEGGDAQR